MEKVRPLWRFIIGFALLMNLVVSSSMFNMQQESFMSFAVSVAAMVTWVYLCIRYRYVDPLRAMYELEIQRDEERKAEKAAEEARREEERKAEEAARAEAEAKREAARAEYERTHGRIRFNIVGVTFKNPDGTSRQALLKEVLASGCDGDLSLEDYEFEGKPAIRINYEGMTLGHVPARLVPEIMPVIDKITDCTLDIKSFTPEDVDDELDDYGDPVHRNREKIYRAEVTLEYEK